MSRMIKIVALLLLLAALGFFLFAPSLAEKSMNQIDGKDLIPVNEEALALHKTLTIVDLHSDTLMWSRDPLERADRGHEDLPRLQEGNVALQLFSSVTKSPAGLNYDNNSADARDDITLVAIGQLQPIRTWFSLLERSLWHAQRLDDAAQRSNGALRKVSTASDLAALADARSGNGQPPVGAMMTIEGLHNLEGKADNLNRLFEAGFRMASLTHFFDNRLAGSMHGEEKGGLTPLGREVMQRMEEMGMVVDIAHCSQKCVAEILGNARRPVVSSHGGVQAVCDVNRNLNDEQIRGLANTGGVIGVGYWDGAVCSTSPRAVAKAMKHIRDLVGIEHVALGSDYDGSVTVRFDTSQLVQVTQALLDEGFSEEAIRAIMGGNALRVLSQGIVPLGDLPQTQATNPQASEK